MISAERWTASCSVRTTVLVGVIACLCFSVGEGLRLRPFPVSALAESEATNTQLNATASYETSLYKYGPLDVPTRVQKRGKRQVVDYGNTPSHNNRELSCSAGSPLKCRRTYRHCFSFFRITPLGARAAFDFLVLIKNQYWPKLSRVRVVRLSLGLRQGLDNVRAEQIAHLKMRDEVLA